MKRRNFISKGLPGFTGALALSHFGCKGTADKKINEQRKGAGYHTVKKLSAGIFRIDRSSLEERKP